MVLGFIEQKGEMIQLRESEHARRSDAGTFQRPSDHFADHREQAGFATLKGGSGDVEQGRKIHLVMNPCKHRPQRTDPELVFLNKSFLSNTDHDLVKKFL